MRKTAFITAALITMFAAPASFAQTGATGGGVSPATPSPPATTRTPSPVTPTPPATTGTIPPITGRSSPTTEIPLPTTDLPSSAAQLPPPTTTLPPGTTGTIPGTTTLPDNDTIISGGSLNGTLGEETDTLDSLDRPFGEESLDSTGRRLSEFGTETETRTLTESDTETPTTILGRETDSDLSEETESPFEEDMGAGSEIGPEPRPRTCSAGRPPDSLTFFLKKESKQRKTISYPGCIRP